MNNNSHNEHLFNQFTVILKKYIEELVTENKHQSLVVAYSGGLDSTALLLMTKRYADERQLSLRALHVNHQLSPDADQWQAHCQLQAEQLDIPFIHTSVFLKREEGNLEAQARRKRYRAISQLTDAQDIILLGQHQNDQVETFLLQLLRGAGTAGLSAMAEFSVNEFGSQLLRPLLSFSKASLQAFVHDSGVAWIEDESNDDVKFDRNYLRHEVLPLLSSRWPATNEVISRSVRHIQEQEELMHGLISQQLNQLVSDDKSLDITRLSSVNTGLQKKLLKGWIKNLGIQQPSEKILLRIIAECAFAKVGAQPKIEWGGVSCRRYDGKLHIVEDCQDFSGKTIDIKGPGQWVLPDDAGIIYLCPELNQIPEELSLCLMLNVNNTYRVTFGDFSRAFKPVGETVTKPLNQWMKLWKIPPWERVRIPLLLQGDKLLAVGNTLSVDARFIDFDGDSNHQLTEVFYRWVV